MYWREIRYWSPVHGANVLRIGAMGDDGMERHCIVGMDVDGKEKRRRRAVALDQLVGAVVNAPAGEVMIDLELTDA